MKSLLIILVCVTPVFAISQDNLTDKVVRLPLNQEQPSVIKLGVHGITTIEFPAKIEALDGYGFSLNPAPDGQDLFQISFNKGTNFISLKAVRPGVEGNLSVVLDGKVYALLCKQAPDPSFVVIFEDGAAKRIAGQPPVSKRPEVSPARLLGFLDKIKAFPTLKVSAPEIYQNMDVAEPESHSGFEKLDISLKRVVRDDALDSVGFEVLLANKSDKDFLYDPESFAVRVGEEVYQQSVSDAGGVVPAGKTQTAFFVVTGGSNGGRNDLAVTNKFEIVLRQIEGEMDPHRKVSAEWQEPPNSLPAAQASGKEPPLPQNGQERSTVKSGSLKRNARRARTEVKNPTKGGADASATQKKMVAHNE
ncbi:MAG TPA: hypothetical protein VHS80_09065 [Chthoniobacterales bacterium]|nr:hypothetical protein [Chthoniobacterales bacterium]